MSELAKQLRGEAITKLPLPADSDEPLVGDITHGAFANPLFKKVLAKFGKTAFARSSACMEFEPFLQQCLRDGDREKTCLEIGTFQGMTALILSQYFKRVVCITVEDDLRRIIKRDIVSHLGITNIEFHDVKDNREKAALIRDFDFDFCYSDGDHAHDTRSDFDLVKHCGRVLFHEVWPLQPPVWNLVNSLPQHEILRAEYDSFAYWQRGTHFETGEVA